MVELVPAPWTSDWTRAQARAIIRSVGQVPVSLARELPGFIVNRMQYALLNECWRLVGGIDFKNPYEAFVCWGNGYLLVLYVSL